MATKTPKIIYISTKTDGRIDKDSVKYIRYDEHLKLKKKLKEYQDTPKSIKFEYHQT